MDDPFKINGPAMVSFSGGRTSGYMLHRIVQAHGGALPDDVVVAFANTGKEREETLRFVHECGARWGVKINWLEWRRDGFEQVGFNSASRNGEPFKALIDWKQRLPNGFERWCTEFLKVKTLAAFSRSVGLRVGEHTEVIGLRNDEPMRILNALHGAKVVKKKGVEVPRVPARKIALPLANAKIGKLDVMRFWLGPTGVFPSDELPQGFDLGLHPWEGNCNLCFLKGKGIRKRIIRDDPSVATWWQQQEVEQGGFFDKRDLVSDLVRDVLESPSFFDDFDPGDFEECGPVCGSAA